MKRILILVLTLLLAVGCVIPSFAAEKASSGDWQYTVRNGEAVITGYSGSDTSVSVPSSVGGYSVTEIGTAALYNSEIEKLSIPSTVRKIGWWAFYGSSKLASVKLHPGLQTISFGAFLNCNSLHEIEVPPTVSSIGDDAFAVSCKTRTGIPDTSKDRFVGQQYYTVNHSFVITGFRGTAAYAYAEDNELNFRGDEELSFGDANADGSVDVKDIVLLENYISDGKLTETGKLNSDLDCDGAVTKADIKLLRSYVKGEISLFEIPSNSYLKPQPNYLYGKKLYSDGDSVAKGTGTDTLGSGFHSYAYYIAEKYGMNFTTEAVGGTTLAKNDDEPLGSGDSILERVLSMKDDYDVILLDGGFNDVFLKVKVGEVTPDSEKSGGYDLSTTAGALEQICYFLTENYSDAVKLFVLCHDCDDRQPLYWDTIRAVLKKWSIPYVDIEKETDFRAVNDEISTQYFFCNDDKTVGDEIHPVAYAQDKVYGKLVERKLNALFAKRYSLAPEKEKIGIAKGETAQLGVEMNGAAYLGGLTWTSSDSDIVSVSQSGAVTAEAIGKATVRAETPDGRIVSFEVDVKQSPLCFYLNKTDATLARNQKISLFPVFLKGTASQDIRYESSDSSVAHVSGDGVVTAKTGGSAVITCKLSNGVKTECIVNVK